MGPPAGLTRCMQADTLWEVFLEHCRGGGGGREQSMHPQKRLCVSSLWSPQMVSKRPREQDQRLVEGDCSQEVSQTEPPSYAFQNGAFTGNIYIIFTHVHSEPVKSRCRHCTYCKTRYWMWRGRHAVWPKRPVPAAPGCSHDASSGCAAPSPAALSVMGGRGAPAQSHCPVLMAPARPSEIHLIPSLVVQVHENLLPSSFSRCFAGSPASPPGGFFIFLLSC